MALLLFLNLLIYAVPSDCARLKYGESCFFSWGCGYVAQQDIDAVTMRVHGVARDG